MADSQGNKGQTDTVYTVSILNNKPFNERSHNNQLTLARKEAYDSMLTPLIHL